METKKILMVTSFYPPYHVGGACTHVYYLSNELAAMGHEVHVLYSKDSYYLKRSRKPNEGEYKNHGNVHLHEIKNPLGRVSPVYSYVTGLVPFKKNAMNVLNNGYDLIHYHNISLLGPKIMDYGSSKKIYTAHDHWLVCPLNDFFSRGKICNKGAGRKKCAACMLSNKRPLQLWRNSGLLKKSLKNIRLIISPSDYLKGFLEKNSIDVPIFTLPNFVPDPGKIGKSDFAEKDYFFYAGMLEEIKGIRNLLKAFRETKGKKLIIAGKGSLESYVKKFIIKNRPGNIEYAGWLGGKKIYNYYKNASAFILPSLCPENSPLTILEAMSAGTPPIGSNTGGIPEIISKVDNNLIFGYGDVDDLRNKIRYFEKKKYSQNKIRKAYKKYFSPKVYLRNYLKVIGSL